MASCVISSKQFFESYLKFCENHPERPKNQKITLDIVEDILLEYNVLLTRQPSINSKVGKLRVYLF